MLSAAPVRPVAVITAGVPTPVAEALNVFVPADVPSVQLPSVATPAAPLVWLPPVMLPPPEVTANETATPVTPFPCWSRTETAGATPTAAPASALWLLPDVTTTCVAAPTVPVALNTTGVRGASEAVSWFVPATVPRVQEPTRAIPVAATVAGDPPTDPAPPVTANPTDAP